MNNQAKEIITEYIFDAVTSAKDSNLDLDDLHNYIFNEDYFIIGYFEAEQMIGKLGFTSFSAIELVKDYEIDNFGEFNTEINSEKICNMLAYILGEQVLSELDLSGLDFNDDYDEIIEQLEKL